MRFRPEPIFTVFAAAALVILIGLGVWQIRRAGETTEMLAHVGARVNGAPLDNTGLSAPAAELSWHTARLTGTWLGDPFLMTGQFEWGEVGYDLVQPFAVDGGPIVLVDRGFVPRSEIAVAEAPTANEVVGLVLDIAEFEGDPAAAPIPASDAGPERWPRNAYAALAARVPGAAPVVVIAGKPLAEGEHRKPDVLPATGWHPVPATRPNLQYAATWFLIAGTLVVVWIGQGFSRGRVTG